MDVSKFRTGDWLMVVGGAVMLVFGLVLDWASIGGVSGNGPFDYFFTGGIAWLLVVAAGVVAFLLAGGVMKPGTTPWPLILLLATALATLLMILRLILGGGEVEGFDLDRDTGMYVAFVAAAVALAGAFLNFRASGGDVRSLTDPDTYRTSFNRPGGGTPPSSGATGTQPPPPPPPASPPPPSV